MRTKNIPYEHIASLRPKTNALFSEKTQTNKNNTKQKTSASKTGHGCGYNKTYAEEAKCKTTHTPTEIKVHLDHDWPIAYTMETAPVRTIMNEYAIQKFSKIKPNSLKPLSKHEEKTAMTSTLLNTHFPPEEQINCAAGSVI